MAKVDLSVLARQCLAQRIPDRDAMTEAVTAWADRHNAADVIIDGQVTTTDARIMLRRLSSPFEP